MVKYRSLGRGAGLPGFECQFHQLKSCVMLGQVTNLSKLQICHLKNGGSNNPCLTESVWRPKERIFICTARSKSLGSTLENKNSNSRAPFTVCGCKAG